MTSSGNMTTAEKQKIQKLRASAEWREATMTMTMVQRERERESHARGAKVTLDTISKVHVAIDKGPRQKTGAARAGCSGAKSATLGGMGGRLEGALALEQLVLGGRRER